MTIRILTVDDEPLALRRLEIILATLDDVDHIGSARGCEEGVGLILDSRPDVVLLDIKMRDGLGFDVLSRLPADYSPAIIITTAFNHFAARAFEVEAVDYLLKPVERDRLYAALQRAQKRLRAQSAEERAAELRALVDDLQQGQSSEAVGDAYESEFWIRGNSSGFTRIEVASIQCITAEDDYIRLHVGERGFLMRETVTGMLGRVNPADFLRVHRSSIVRRELIHEVKRNSLGLLEVHLTTGKKLRVGRVYAKALKDRITVS